MEVLDSSRDRRIFQLIDWLSLIKKQFQCITVSIFKTLLNTLLKALNFREANPSKILPLSKIKPLAFTEYRQARLLATACIPRRCIV